MSDTVKIAITHRISQQAMNQIQKTLGMGVRRTRQILVDLLASNGMKKNSMFVFGTGNNSSAWNIVHREVDVYEITDIYKNGTTRIIRLRNGETRTVRYGSKNRRSFMLIMDGDDMVVKEPKTESTPEGEGAAKDIFENDQESNG